MYEVLVLAFKELSVYVDEFVSLQIISRVALSGNAKGEALFGEGTESPGPSVKGGA